VKKNKLLLLFICACLYLLVGCQNEKQNASPPSEAPPEKEEQLEFIKPNTIDSAGFIENVGWVNTSEIMTVREEDGNTAIYIHNLHNQKEEKIYEVTTPYVQAVLSPDKEKVFIHTAPLTYSANITIIDLKGNELFQQEIPSYELYYSWNSFNSNFLVIASFAEDWSFEVFTVDIEKKQMDKMDVAEPFLQWKAENAVIYQSWNTMDISFTAPLIAQNIFNGETETIVEESMHFKQFRNNLLSIEIENENDNLFSYKFISENGKIQSSFKLPLLSRYSDWLVPYYDMIEGEDTFLTFVAGAGGTVDSYDGNFSLRTWNLKTGKEEILLEDLSNEPLQCSKDGAYCLYGMQLEKVIDITKKKTITLLEEGKES
jgi:hypothetical protein